MDDWSEKKTLGQLLDDAATRFGSREAYVFKEERLTYRQVRDRVDQLAGGLLRLGVKKGDRVSLWLPNCIEWIYIYFAVAKIGAALVPVNTRFKSHETAYIVGQSDSTTLIITDKFLNVDTSRCFANCARSWPVRKPAGSIPTICQSCAT